MQYGECQAFLLHDQEVLRTNSPLVIEQEPWTSHQGTTHWFRTIKMPIQFPNCPTYVLGISADITEDRDNKERIRSSELLLQTILDAIQYRIFLLDDKLRVVWANQAAQADVDNFSENLLGSSCRDLCKPDKHCISCPAEQSLRTGEMRFAEIKTAQGAVTLEVSTIPIKDTGGSVTNVVYIAEDVSQRLGFEQQLRQAQKMESLGILAGGIAHDFNNILTAVLGFTELAMYKTGDNVSLNNDLQEVYRASVRARDLVNQILTFSRRIDKELQPLDISLIIKEALKLLRATLPTSIQMAFRLDQDPCLVLADPTQIHQIVMNLCTNAAHAMRKDGGSLSVSLRRRSLTDAELVAFRDLTPGAYIELRVADTGHGIDDAVLPYIFDPYFTTKDLGEGTGLGLSVVHGIVKEYGGDIQVTTKTGHGTTFTLMFPLAPEKVMPTQSAAAPPPSKGFGYLIMVVDDEPTILKLCRRMLESFGYEVITETDPRAALERICSTERTVDLLLSDLTMPHMTGDKLAAAVHEHSPILPVILMSGNKTGPGDLSTVTEFTDFIDKPIDKQHLFETIQRMLAIP